MQQVICSEKSSKNKARSIQALCLDKQCKLNRNMCTNCFQNHRHNQPNNQQQFIQHTMIDFHYLIDILRKEISSRNQAQAKFEEETLNSFAEIKERIIEEITNMENLLIQLLSQIKEKDTLIPIYNLLTGQQQLNSTLLNEIGSKLSDLMEEKQNLHNTEQEIFYFKSFNFHSSKEYLKMRLLLAQVKLTLQMIQFKGESEISRDLIEYAIHHQSLQEKQIVFLLSTTAGNHKNRKYKGILWDAGKIIQKYQSSEYDFEFSSVDLVKPYTIEKISLNIQKIQSKMVQVEYQIDFFEKFKFNITPTFLSGHTYEIRSVAISNNQKYIASGDCAGGSYQVFLTDLQSVENVKKYRGPQYVLHLIFSRDNSRLVAGGGYNSFDIFMFDITDLRRNDPIQLFKGHSDIIERTVFTKNSKYLISGSYDKTLRVWCVDEQKEIAKKQYANYINGVAISDNEELIGCCCHGGLAYIFDSKTFNSLNEKIPPWQAHPTSSNCIEFIQDSSILLTSGVTEIRLWSVQDLLLKKTQHMKEIKSGESNYIWTVTAYPISNPKVIVACDGKIKIWKLEDAQLKQTIEVQGGLTNFAGNQFALTSDFKKIIIGGQDQKLKIFEQF